MSTANIKVGDVVYADFSGYGRVSVRQGRVTSISGTGVVRVLFNAGKTVSFMKNGWERGTSTSAAGKLIDHSTYLRLKSDAGTQSICRKVRDHINTLAATPVTAHNKAELIAQLEAALDAVRRIPE